MVKGEGAGMSKTKEAKNNSSDGTEEQSKQYGTGDRIEKRKFAGGNNGSSIIITGAPTPDVLQRLPIRPQSATKEAWALFEGELASSVADLDEDEFLIITMKKNHYFVQFAGQGGFGMRVEAVSNAYLKDGRKLSEAACMKLLAFGWNPPTKVPDELDEEGHKPDGSPNYFLDIDSPVPYGSVASLAVRTLRDIFGAMHPGELQYKAFGKDDCNIRFPNLRIARER